MRFITCWLLLAFVAIVGIAQAQGWEVVQIPNSPGIFDLAMEGSTLWIATHVGQGSWISHTTENSGISQNTFNYVIFVDSTGDKWITRDDRDDTIDRLDNGGTFGDKSDDVWTYYVYRDDHHPNVVLDAWRIFSAAEDAQGFRWFGIRDENSVQDVTLALLIDHSDTTTADDEWFHYDRVLAPDSTSFSDLKGNVSALAVDTASRLWIGYYTGGVDVWRYGNPRTFADDDWARYDDTNGLPSDDVHEIYAASDGRVWVGTTRGLAVFDPASESWTTIDGLPGTEALALDSDARGHIWVGTDEGVVMLYGNGTVAATYGVEDGLHDDRVRSIAVDKGDGTIWAMSDPDNVTSRNEYLNRFSSGFGPGIGEVFLYPNPWRESEGAEAVTAFGVPEGSKVQILDITGELMRELPPTEPYVWDTLDSSFNKAPSGLYVVRVETAQGEVLFLKAAIIR
jgi:hypothetical protein